MLAQLVLLFKITYIILQITVYSTSSARILGFISTASYSHQVPFHELWRKLSLAGHQVTVATTDPINDISLSNLTEINLNSSYSIWREKFNPKGLTKLRTYKAQIETAKINYAIHDYQLQHPDIQKLLQDDNQHFDVVLVEYVYPGMLELSIRFNCPLIQLATMDTNNIYYRYLGNHLHPATNSEFMLGFSGKLNFLQRLKNTLYVLFNYYLMNFVLVPSVQWLTEKNIGRNYPSPLDVFQNTSIMFPNTNSIFHSIRPTLPNLISLQGGIHLKTPKPLPGYLQTLLDRASTGAIYCSFGCNIQIDNLPVNIRRVLTEVFAELPYTILWKFEEENSTEIPNNVFVSKWFPQQDVLRHPNVKLFITQGGLQSTEEAIYNHVPIIGMPFLFDQPITVKTIASWGAGLMVDPKLLNKEILKNTVLEIMNQPVYGGNANRLADLLQDQPMTGLERVIWWIQYVLRHHGAKHLKSPVIDLPLYKQQFLDSISFCLLMILIDIYLLVKAIK